LHTTCALMASMFLSDWFFNNEIGIFFLSVDYTNFVIFWEMFCPIYFITKLKNKTLFLTISN
jgi:hypothetical protein